jgi:hypothetical protein
MLPIHAALSSRRERIADTNSEHDKLDGALGGQHERPSVMRTKATLIGIVLSYLRGQGKADLSALRRARRRARRGLSKRLLRKEIGRSPNSEVVTEASAAARPSNPNVDSLRSSATTQARSSPEADKPVKFRDDFERKLRQRTRSRSPGPPSVIILGTNQKD